MSRGNFLQREDCDMKRTSLTHRSLGQALPSAFQQTHVPPGCFLIANLELAFELNGNDFKCLQISNRKYFAIFRVGPRHLVTNSLAGAFLIETPRLESLATPTKQSPSAKSNRDKIGLLSSAPRGATSRATLTLRASQSNLPASCFVRVLAGEHS
jgi:hypothetical protein